jgi:adenine-specific DNA-methyltransferase
LERSVANAGSKQELGQFLTPNPLADFMGSLFEAPWREWNLLDAGAGAGVLSAALVLRLCANQRKPKRISITAYEVDTALIDPLRTTLAVCQRTCERAGISFSATVFNLDFIEAAVPIVRGDLFASHAQQFNAAIVNPPYRKIRSDSPARLLLRSAGIETSNLYTGFLALIVRLLSDGGEMVAITPRSFCNGPYFRPFRTDFLESMSLRRLHVFESRSAAFRTDDVLQENIIVHAVKTRTKPEQVIVSTGSGEISNNTSRQPEATRFSVSASQRGLTFTTAEFIEKARAVSYSEVVSPDDTDQFIHLVFDDHQASARSLMNSLPASLPDLGLTVSTGRVVDFRAKEFLREQPGKGTVPLIYPCHFNGGFVHWPKEKCRKPNAIISDEKTRELLIPAGIYVLVKRFSSKEERRRIVACIYDPKQIDAPLVGFENHLNYFHVNGHGLTMSLAKGLAAFLNSSVVDNYFRQFNGHTQVNATDLRSLNYPTKLQLERLGHQTKPGIGQVALDEVIEREFNVRR